MQKIDRRRIVAGAGAAIVCASPIFAIAGQKNQKTILASSCRYADGSFGVVLIDQSGKLISTIDLPARGHDIAFDQKNERAVVFARRPGNFAIAFSTNNTNQTRFFTTGTQRHFYGHGTFSQNGKLLYASENDLTSGTGKIGIYDATDNFARIGEFDSYGIGPHQILLMPNGHTLAICNGGIRTHPSTGRAKLNLEDMQPSLVFLDTQDGSIEESHLLPPEFRLLSIRHMAVRSNSQIIFGCQYQGQKTHILPLVGSCQFGEGIELWDIPDNFSNNLQNYIGSVALSNDGMEVATSSPIGGTVTIFSTLDRSVVRQISIDQACGLAPSGNDILVSTLNGNIGLLNSGVVTSGIRSFDNHIVSSQPT